MNVSGNGKGHGACTLWFILEVLTGVIMFFTFRWLANEYGFNQGLGFLGGGGKNGLYNYFMGAGIILGIACVIYGILMPIAISKTRITISEDKVEGVGVSKYFMWGDPRTFNFMYPVSQVSIEVNGGKLVVQGQNTYYSVYVKNGAEIQNALFEAKKKQ